MAANPQFKVNQLAKDLGIKSKDIIDTLAEKGINAKTQGALEGRDFDILMVVMRAKLLPQARDIVKQVDDGAFMIVTNATSVFGEGFKEYDSEEV